jgi:hypothetical protein
MAFHAMTCCGTDYHFFLLIFLNYKTKPTVLQGWTSTGRGRRWPWATSRAT